MRNFIKSFFIFLIFALTLTQITFAGNQLKIATIFGDNMVIQQQCNPAIWGWAKSEDKIIIDFAGFTTHAIANSQGNWMTRLPQLSAGGPFTMKIFNNSGDTITFRNVMVGEVWLASGQSNMTWAIGWGIDNKDEAIRKSTNPNIRFFTVADDLNNHPQDDVLGGKWVESNPSNATEFSATAYFFASNLQAKLKVPVGIIHSSWGGTNVESWISSEMLKTHADFKNILPELIKNTGNFDNGYEDFSKKNKTRDSIIEHSNCGIKMKVFEPAFDDSEWKTMKIPCKWSDAGIRDFYGYCWFRKTIEIPESEKGKDLKLSLGDVCCENICYFNGEAVNRANENLIVEYQIPGKLVKPGKNIICLRILGRWAVGGFNSYAGIIYMESLDHDFNLSLASEWKFNEKIETETPEWKEYYNYPSFIYNAKIAPLIPYSIKGVIWYQGENNTARATQYKSLFPMLINDWRTRWGEGYMPFIFGQLANYGARNPEPEESKTAELREAQLEGLNLLNTAMVVNIDLGLTDGDVHFRNKQECGARFAQAALGLAYGEKSEFSGPVFQSKIVEGSRIRIRFSHAENGLATKNGELVKSIFIAGMDFKYIAAQVRIDNNELIVWSDQVPNPTAVRYGWADNPDCNLYNTDGLPTSPFRTDP